MSIWKSINVTIFCSCFQDEKSKMTQTWTQGPSLSLPKSSIIHACLENIEDYHLVAVQNRCKQFWSAIHGPLPIDFRPRVSRSRGSFLLLVGIAAGLRRDRIRDESIRSVIFRHMPSQIWVVIYRKANPSWPWGAMQAPAASSPEPNPSNPQNLGNSASEAMASYAPPSTSQPRPAQRTSESSQLASALQQQVLFCLNTNTHTSPPHIVYLAKLRRYHLSKVQEREITTSQIFLGLWDSLESSQGIAFKGPTHHSGLASPSLVVQLQPSAPREWAYV